ncbi:hypothetical protein Ari01nite_98750 [Paractinoplanes rishiriensis]|uniref:Uncharacterized protein n=1 Tax=Paractinoplanes rishiriensis TaxID=1050105 RepID=A0A919N1V0_9ACTN|nr:hypothetical protein Ari01nite_98750 [Actinoplanes rishiriensis]
MRADCSCGQTTTLCADQGPALTPLRAQHGLSRPQCVLCGADYEGRSWQQQRDDLAVFTDDATGNQLLVCRMRPRVPRRRRPTPGPPRPGRPRRFRNLMPASQLRIIPIPGSQAVERPRRLCRPPTL